MMYGIMSRQPEGESERRWYATHSAEDMLLDISQFIACDTIEQGCEELERRYACPAEIAGLPATRVLREHVSQYNKEIRSAIVHAVPVIGWNGHTDYSPQFDIDALEYACREYGRVRLRRHLEPGQYSGSRAVSTSLRMVSGFHGSDLVVRDLDGNSEIAEVYLDPKRAKARRSRAAGTSKRQEQKAARERAEQLKNEEMARRRMDLILAYGTVQEAGNDLVNSKAGAIYRAVMPMNLLDHVRQQYHWSWHGMSSEESLFDDPFVRLQRLIALDQQLRAGAGLAAQDYSARPMMRKAFRFMLRVKKQLNTDVDDPREPRRAKTKSGRCRRRAFHWFMALARAAYPSGRIPPERKAKSSQPAS